MYNTELPREGDLVELRHRLAAAQQLQPTTLGLQTGRQARTHARACKGARARTGEKTTRALASWVYRTATTLAATTYEHSAIVLRCR